MSSSWRNIFTYNKYAQITARAVRASLKEDHRVAADKRGLTALRYQQWENGLGSAQVLLSEAEKNNSSSESGKAR
ncbi:hypothetical protein AX15_002732 [Amanita polypyramis BW_CC]|nr:hypothetical protein AX15_002732 [Amanita polypyramis BW_CC]